MSQNDWGAAWDNVGQNEHADMVNHPPHYTFGEVECIDAIKASMPKAAFMGYLKGQVIKYIWRYGSKGNPLEDLKKAQFYLDRLVKEMEDGKR